MATLPELADFVGTYDAGRPQVVWTSLGADLETPVELPDGDAVPSLDPCDSAQNEAAAVLGAGGQRYPAEGDRG